MQAILVKYYPATNHRGAYRIASANAGKLRIPCSITDNLSNPERFCAYELAASLGWIGDLMQGTLPNGDDVFVFDHPLSRR